MTTGTVQPDERIGSRRPSNRGGRPLLEKAREVAHPRLFGVNAQGATSRYTLAVDVAPLPVASQSNECGQYEIIPVVVPSQTAVVEDVRVNVPFEWLPPLTAANLPVPLTTVSVSTQLPPPALVQVN